MSPLYFDDDLAVELLLPVLMFSAAPGGCACFSEPTAALPRCMTGQGSPGAEGEVEDLSTGELRSESPRHVGEIEYPL
eukprot:12828217-Heterocapsa_arctica.AAC.1